MIRTFLVGLLTLALGAAPVAAQTVGFYPGPGPVPASSSGAVPSGPAGGALGGTYPNPTLGSFSSAQLAGALTDETGTGLTVFGTSPTLVTPALGTPSALVCTNCTGTAAGLTAGSVTTNANLTGAVTSVGNATSLGSFTSANLSGALTNETGSGLAVFATSPALTTPTATTLAIGGATVGSDALAWTGSATGSGSLGLGGSVQVGGAQQVRWAGANILTSGAAAALQLGAADAAAPVAQTLKVQSVVTGTLNTAGQNWTFQGSQGTGTGAGGSILFQTAPAGLTGSTPNAFTTIFTVAPNGASTTNLTVASGGAFGFGDAFIQRNGLGSLILNSGAGNTATITASGSGSTTFGGSVLSGSVIGSTAGLNTGATGYMNWSTRAVLRSPADAVLRIANAAETSTADLTVSGASTTGTSGVIFGGFVSGSDWRGSSLGGAVYPGTPSRAFIQSSGTATLRISDNAATNSADITVSTGNLATFNGPVAATSYLKSGATTVTGLGTCTAGGVGTRWMATDSLVVALGNFGNTVANGGANTVPVYCDGTSWKIGANDNTPLSPAMRRMMGVRYEMAG